MPYGQLLHMVDHFSDTTKIPADTSTIAQTTTSKMEKSTLIGKTLQYHPSTVEFSDVDPTTSDVTSAELAGSEYSLFNRMTCKPASSFICSIT